MISYISKRSFSSIPKPKIVIFGGNGYVGQQVCQSAINLGFEVVSINRSGSPKSEVAWKQNVRWVTGDINNKINWPDELQGATGVVSCVGAFGTNEFMEKINGDANINAISESLNAGVKHFVYISTVENNLPEFILKGYFHGKKRTEQALLDAFPDTGTVLRPGFIYGNRQVGPITLPLWLLGKPMETILSLQGLDRLRCLPGMKAVFAPPIPVDTVGLVAAAAANGLTGPGRVMTIQDIVTTAKQLKTGS